MEIEEISQGSATGLAAECQCTLQLIEVRLNECRRALQETRGSFRKWEAQTDQRMDELKIMVSQLDDPLQRKALKETLRRMNGDVGIGFLKSELFAEKVEKKIRILVKLRKRLLDALGRFAAGKRQDMPYEA